MKKKASAVAPQNGSSLYCRQTDGWIDRFSSPGEIHTSQPCPQICDRKARKKIMMLFSVSAAAAYTALSRVRFCARLGTNSRGLEEPLLYAGIFLLTPTQGDT